MGEGKRSIAFRDMCVLVAAEESTRPLLTETHALGDVPDKCQPAMTEQRGPASSLRCGATQRLEDSLLPCDTPPHSEELVPEREDPGTLGSCGDQLCGVK